MDEKYQIQLLKDSSLFDASWYLQRYPDVAAIKMAPEQHYLRYGWRIGRSPSPSFCGTTYLQSNPDVVRAKENPLVHYLRFGRQEGRKVYSPNLQKPTMTLEPVATDQESTLTPVSSMRTAKCEESSAASAVELQLKETQQLLEHYFRRCQEFEFQLLDQKI